MSITRLLVGIFTVTAIGLTACQKNSDGGAPAPTPAPPAPAPESTPAPAPAGPAACTEKGFGSVDIAEGKITCRKFSLFYGAVKEIGKESCHSDQNSKTVRFSGMMYKGHDEVQFDFDNTGALNILIKNFSGEYRNEAPVAYTLDGATQELIISPFRLVGIPSQPYVRQVVTKGLVNERYYFMKLANGYDVEGSPFQTWNQLNGVNPVSYGGGVNYGTGGFNPEHVPGQPIPTSTPGDFNAPVNAAGSPNSGYVAATFNQGLRVGIRVAAPMFPQHVVRMFVWPDSQLGREDQSYETDIFVTSTNVQCRYTSDKTAIRAILQ